MLDIIFIFSSPLTSHATTKYGFYNFISPSFGLTNHTGQYWRLLTNQLAFTNSSELFLCQILLYNVAVGIERTFGSLKYFVSQFPLTCALTPKVLNATQVVLTRICIGIHTTQLYIVAAILSPGRQLHSFWTSTHYFLYNLPIPTYSSLCIQLPHTRRIHLEQDVHLSHCLSCTFSRSTIAFATI